MTARPQAFNRGIAAAEKSCRENGAKNKYSATLARGIFKSNQN
jgi:hypothetical protein